jgi:hypothetical protein
VYGVPVPNPTGIEQAVGILEVGQNTVLPTLLILMLAAPASVLVRFWHARSEERQQFNWFIYPQASGSACQTRPRRTSTWCGPVIGNAMNILLMVAVVLIPVVVGIAILRYRVYDIDLLIDRTLVF